MGNNRCLAEYKVAAVNACMPVLLRVTDEAADTDWADFGLL